MNARSEISIKNRINSIIKKEKESLLKKIKEEMIFEGQI